MVLLYLVYFFHFWYIAFVTSAWIFLIIYTFLFASTKKMYTFYFQILISSITLVNTKRYGYKQCCALFAILNMGDSCHVHVCARVLSSKFLDNEMYVYYQSNWSSPSLRNIMCLSGVHFFKILKYSWNNKLSLEVVSFWAPTLSFFFGHFFGPYTLYLNFSFWI